MRPEQLRLAGLQGVITIIGAAVTYVIVAPLAAKSVAFGGCVATVGTLFLAWRFVTGERREHLGAEWVLRHAYRTAIERFMLVAFLLAIGFELLKLAPSWMLAGFICGQLAWLAVPVWTSLKKKNDK
ncbi:MAG TPA: ATP synthase subunit I [Gallionellaceae bacterium]|nr:ATP synthase subunit I [Gallionellaceae bacterium]